MALGFDSSEVLAFRTGITCPTWKELSLLSVHIRRGTERTLTASYFFSISMEA